jgi:uncharacterized protein involved in exopolysaccharide biosynthesis
MRELQITIDGYKRELEEMKAEKRISLRNTLMSQAEGAAKGAQEAADVATKKVDSLKAVLGDLAIQMSEYLSINEELTATRQALKDVKDELDSAAAANAGAQVTWAQPPQVPDSPSFPKLFITMSLAMVLGLGLSLGIAFLREMMDTSVRRWKRLRLRNL